MTPQQPAHAFLSHFEIDISGETQMNTYKNIFNPLVWLMPLLLAAFVTGCGGGSGGGSSVSTTVPGMGTGTGAGRGPAPVVLGAAGNFAVLAKSAVSTTGTTAITGNIGLSPAAASFITGFSLIADASNVFSTSALVTGQIYASDYAVPTPSTLTTAVNNMLTAYTDAAGRAPDYTELGAGNIGGMTLAPGTYKWGTGLLIPTDVTLNGGPNDVWIFQVAQGITQASGARIILAGGALSRNIFWQSFGAVDIGTTAHMEGVVMSQTSITLRTGASANGRLLAQTAVTFDGNAVTQPAL
ncbi:MAG: ice-binding family protein [Gallionella sp.]|nr:ice-binding family protein [Gallionella sp.]